MSRTYKNLISIAAGLCLSCVIAVASVSSVEEDTKPAHPASVKISGDNIIIASKDHKAVDIFSASSKQKMASIKFNERVTGVAVTGDKGYVTTVNDADGFLHLVDLKNHAITKTIKLSSGSKYPYISPDGKFVYVCNQYKGTVSKIDAENLNVLGQVAVLREPFACVATADGKFLYVNNFLPYQPANLDFVAADVSVIDVETMTKVKDIKLDNGSNALRGITLSPDGKYVFITHNLGRFQVPTSQLQQGWMNTSAMSVIDVASQAFLGSVLLDEPERGAAGIWGVQCDKDNIVITQSGTHDISIISYDTFKTKFEAYKKKNELSYDLYFLYGIRQRLPIIGNGPRDFALDNGKAYIPTYFSDTLNIVTIADRQIDYIACNPSRIESNLDLGERAFNDATYCFQNWQSCNGCHPGEARTDGMNWDLMNDGIGNPKNCKSLLLSHQTNPNMISGIRPTAEIAVRAGFKSIQFSDVPEEVAQSVDEYLKSLKPMPSPYLKDGQMTDLAKKGRQVFEKLKCDECHSGVYFTDYKLHVIGEDVEFEKGWDTPTLIEVWRTAPYLFNGRATTLDEVFVKYKHGIDGKASQKDIDALVEYVNSL